MKNSNLPKNRSLWLSFCLVTDMDGEEEFYDKMDKLTRCISFNSKKTAMKWYGEQIGLYSKPIKFVRDY